MAGLTAGNCRIADHLVAGDRVGWLHIDRNNTLTLLTSTEPVRLKADTPVRYAMGSDRAGEKLKALATPGSGATADDLTLREIAFERRLSMRMLQLILRRADGTIERPESPLGISDHDYMGAFTVTNELVVADRCYIAETNPLLANRTPAVPGRWHAFVRHEILCVDVSVAMFAYHEAHVDDATENGEELGTFGVDSGSAVIVDARATERLDFFRDGDRAWQEGLVDDLGLFAFTAIGDGLYKSRVHRRDGRATMVRASLSDENMAYYRPPKPRPPAKYSKELEQHLAADGEIREYSAKTKYAQGDRIRHPKFGDGVVNELLPDRKISVAFRDGVRALVHAR